MNERELTPLSIFKRDMQTAARIITLQLNERYKWRKKVECHFCLTEDGLCWFSLGIIKPSGDFGNRVLINFPDLVDLNLEADWRNIKMAFNFLDVDDNCYYDELSAVKFYRGEEMLFSRFFLREVKRFILFKQVNVNVFKAFEVEVS